MTKGINYWAFQPESDGSGMDPRKAMDLAANLGFDAFELTIDSRDGPLSFAMSRSEAEAIRRHAERIGISLSTLASGAAWSESPTHPDPAVRRQAQQNTRRLIEIASWLGVDTLLYLPGMVSAVFVPDFVPQRYDLVLDRSRESLEAVLPDAEKAGVRLGIENVWNRFLLSPVEMKEYIDSFSTELIGSYFDIGNCLLYGHPEHWIEILGSRILAVHMKDFRVEVGNLNGFVDLLAGDVDFDACFQAFRSVEYDGPFTVEYVPGIPGAPEKGAAAMMLLEERWRNA